MTDAELIDYLKDSHKFTSSRTARVALDCAADRLTQLSEDNARAQEDIANLTASLAAEVAESERLRAALDQGQKEGNGHD